MTHVKIHGLGDIGMQVISLQSSDTTVNDLFGRIQDACSIPIENQLLFTEQSESLSFKDRSRTLKNCGIRHGSSINFVRNFEARGYPSVTVHLRVLKNSLCKYFGFFFGTLSTFAFLSRMVVGSEYMKETYPYPLDWLAWWPASYLIGTAATCTIALDVGHWIASFPIVPAALFTLINKGQKQIQSNNKLNLLNMFELRLVKLISHYVPALVQESINMLTRNQKAVKLLHNNYGGTRVRFVCADGIAVDGMHVRPSKESKQSRTGGKGSKCFIAVNGNAEFYELDGMMSEFFWWWWWWWCCCLLVVCWLFVGVVVVIIVLLFLSLSAALLLEYLKLLFLEVFALRVLTATSPSSPSSPSPLPPLPLHRQIDRTAAVHVTVH